MPIDSPGEYRERLREDRERLREIIRDLNREFNSLKVKFATPSDPVVTLENREELNILLFGVTTDVLSSGSQADSIFALTQTTLDDLSGTRITIAKLQDKFRELSGRLELQDLADIREEIADYEVIVINASEKYQEAIDQLNELAQGFATLTFAVSLIQALVTVSSGNFSGLVTISSELLGKLNS